ncbi:hypothetical protein JB92DRAFT_2829259 [Gautieria morchelliformis]|nr:hypothetical protein JB92DRAFT_2829259 [Gautieria morchelliformis]
MAIAHRQDRTRESLSSRMMHSRVGSHHTTIDRTGRGTDEKYIAFQGDNAACHDVRRVEEGVARVAAVAQDDEHDLGRDHRSHEAARDSVARGAQMQRNAQLECSVSECGSALVASIGGLQTPRRVDTSGKSILTGSKEYKDSVSVSEPRSMLKDLSCHEAV